MTRPAAPRKPRARSQARIESILVAARTLLASEEVACLSIYDVFALAMELSDRVYARSVQLHDEIIPRLAEEGMRVFDVYMGLYLPPFLPKREQVA